MLSQARQKSKSTATEMSQALSYLEIISNGFEKVTLHDEFVRYALRNPKPINPEVIVQTCSALSLLVKKLKKEAKNPKVKNIEMNIKQTTACFIHLISYHDLIDTKHFTSALSIVDHWDRIVTKLQSPNTNDIAVHFKCYRLTLELLKHEKENPALKQLQDVREYKGTRELVVKRFLLNDLYWEIKKLVDNCISNHYDIMQIENSEYLKPRNTINMTEEEASRKYTLILNDTAVELLDAITNGHSDRLYPIFFKSLQCFDLILSLPEAFNIDTIGTANEHLKTWMDFVTKTRFKHYQELIASLEPIKKTLNRLLIRLNSNSLTTLNPSDDDDLFLDAFERFGECNFLQHAVCFDIERIQELITETFEAPLCIESETRQSRIEKLTLNLAKACESPVFSDIYLRNLLAQFDLFNKESLTKIANLSNHEDQLKEYNSKLNVSYFIIHKILEIPFLLSIKNSHLDLIIQMTADLHQTLQIGSKLMQQGLLIEEARTQPLIACYLKFNDLNIQLTLRIAIASYASTQRDTQFASYSFGTILSKCAQICFLIVNICDPNDTRNIKKSLEIEQYTLHALLHHDQLWSCQKEFNPLNQKANIGSLRTRYYQVSGLLSERSDDAYPALLPTPVFETNDGFEEVHTLMKRLSLTCVEQCFDEKMVLTLYKLFSTCFDDLRSPPSVFPDVFKHIDTNVTDKVDELYQMFSDSKLKPHQIKESFLTTFLCVKNILLFPDRYTIKQFVTCSVVLRNWMRLLAAQLPVATELRTAIELLTKELGEHIKTKKARKVKEELETVTSETLPTWFYRSTLAKTSVHATVQPFIMEPVINECNRLFNLELNTETAEIERFRHQFIVFLGKNTQEKLGVLCKQFENHTSNFYKAIIRCPNTAQSFQMQKQLLDVTHFIIDIALSLNSQFKSYQCAYNFWLIRLQYETLKSFYDLSNSIAFPFKENHHSGFVKIHTESVNLFKATLANEKKSKRNMDYNLSITFRYLIESSLILIRLNPDELSRAQSFLLIEDLLCLFNESRTFLLSNDKLTLSELDSCYTGLLQQFFRVCSEFNYTSRFFVHTFLKPDHQIEFHDEQIRARLNRLYEETHSLTWEKKEADYIQRLGAQAKELLIYHDEMKKHSNKATEQIAHIRELSLRAEKSSQTIKQLKKEQTPIKLLNQELTRNLEQARTRQSELEQSLTAASQKTALLEKRSDRFSKEAQGSRLKVHSLESDRDLLQQRLEDQQRVSAQQALELETLRLQNLQLSHGYHAARKNAEETQLKLRTFEDRQVQLQLEHDSFLQQKPSFKILSQTPLSTKSNLLLKLEADERESLTSTLKVQLPRDVQDIVSLITANNEQAYIVGGFVRNALLKLDSRDVDLITTCSIDTIKHLFPHFKQSPYTLWLFKHGDIDLCCDPNLDLKNDAYSRDLTVNALYCTDKGLVLDPTKRGIPDLFAKQLVTIKPMQASMIEDPIRILRLLRQWLEKQWSIEQELPILRVLSNELRRVPFGIYLRNIGLLLSSTPFNRIQTLARNGLLNGLFFAQDLNYTYSEENRVQLLQSCFSHNPNAYQCIGMMLLTPYQNKLMALGVDDTDNQWAMKAVEDFLALWQHESAFIEPYPRTRVQGILTTVLVELHQKMNYKMDIKSPVLYQYRAPNPRIPETDEKNVPTNQFPLNYKG